MTMIGREWTQGSERLRPPLTPDDRALPPVETAGGLALPLPLVRPGYVYVSQASFSFDLWMGGDFDVTVRLLGEVRLALLGAKPQQFDIRSARRSDLAPLLAIEGYEVKGGRAEDDGTLIIDLQDGECLTAFSREGLGWEVVWPLVYAPSWWVSGRDGGVQVNAERPPSAAKADSSAGRSFPEPQPGGARWPLPIRGQIVECDVSFSTVELDIPIDDENRFCVHLAGAFSLTTKGERQEIRADSEDRQDVGPALDLVGKTVAKARVDHSRLELELTDGTRLTTADGLWEAHGPARPGNAGEWWFPEGGPQFP